MQPAIVTRYSPYFTLLERSGSGTWPDGCGALFINRETGNAIITAVSRFRIGAPIAEVASSLFAQVVRQPAPIEKGLALCRPRYASVVDVAGRVTLGRGSIVLGNTLRDMVRKGHKKILINLGQVSYLDSSAVGELVAGVTTVVNQGGQLKLLGLTKHVRDFLLITKQYTI